LWRLIQAIGVSSLIIPCGPIFWFVMCAIRAGGLRALLNSVAEWEEFSYKWPAACVLSTFAAVLVSVNIMFFEKHGGVRSTTAACYGRWALTRVVFPGLVIVGAAYGILALYGLWFGTVLGFVFICYLIGLFVTVGKVTSSGP